MADSTTTITLVGDQKLLKGLQTGGAFAKNELAKALNKAANDVIQAAVEKAPHKNGRLWGAIHGENADSVNASATPQNLTAVVGTKLKYARAQEYGTVGMVIHSHSKSGKAFTYKGNIKPKLYMTQARNLTKPKLTNYLQLAASRIIQNIVSGF